MKDDYLWDGSGDRIPKCKSSKSAGAFTARSSCAVIRTGLCGCYALRKPVALPEFPVWSFCPSHRCRHLTRCGGVDFLAIETCSESWTSLGCGPPRRRTARRFESHPRKRGDWKAGCWTDPRTDDFSRAAITFDETAASKWPKLRPGWSPWPGHQRSISSRNDSRHYLGASGEFVVDTSSAVAVDLGCVYTLHVTIPERPPAHHHRLSAQAERHESFILLERSAQRAENWSGHAL